MSPGTSVDIGISCGRSMPARSTAVVDVTIALSSSAALLERNSCQKRKSVLSNTIVLRTIIVLNVRSSGAAKITSVNSETTLTVNSTPLNGVTNAWKSCWYQVGGFSCDTSLGPYCSMRASNCSSVRPVLLASSRASASSGDHAHRRAGGSHVQDEYRPQHDGVAQHTFAFLAGISFQQGGGRTQSDGDIDHRGAARRHGSAAGDADIHTGARRHRLFVGRRHDPG